MLSYSPSLPTRALLSLFISLLIVFFCFHSDYSFISDIFQNCLALEVVSYSYHPLLIVKNDAKVTEFDTQDYIDGFGESETSGNYVLKCAEAQERIGDGDYYLKVNIGELNDYVIPYDPVNQTGASVCDALTKLDPSGVMLSYYLYSSVEPCSAKFNGSAKLVPKSNGGIRFYLGGSDVGLSDDDRYTITRWGRVQKKVHEYGGCCFNTTAEAHKTWLYGSWGKPFNIIAYNLNGSFVYLSKAVVEYNTVNGSYNMSLKARINDLYLRLPPVQKCIYTVTVSFSDSPISKVYHYRKCEFEDNLVIINKPLSANFFVTYIDSTYNKPFWPSKSDTFKNTTVQAKKLNPSNHLV